MKTITIQDIRSYGPCYDPNKFLSEDWKGTAIDILKMDNVSFPDRLWVVLRTDLVTERTMRLFAVWSARKVEHLVREDERKKFNDILDVIQRYAMGEATDTERDAAQCAARDAAQCAARDAAWGTAWDAAQCAARDAAQCAARDAARGTAWDAARGTAWDAAWDAAQCAQRDKLIEMIEAENK